MNKSSFKQCAGDVYVTPVMSVLDLAVEGVLCNSLSDFGSDMELLEEEDYDWVN